MWLERGRRGWGGFWRGCGRSLTLDEGHAELGTAGPTRFPMCIGRDANSRQRCSGYVPTSSVLKDLDRRG